MQSILCTLITGTIFGPLVSDIFSLNFNIVTSKTEVEWIKYKLWFYCYEKNGINNPQFKE